MSCHSCARASGYIWECQSSSSRAAAELASLQLQMGDIAMTFLDCPLRLTSWDRLSAPCLIAIAACCWLWELWQQHPPLPGQPQAHARVPMSVLKALRECLCCSCPHRACRECPSTAAGSCTRLRWVPGCVCQAAAPSQRAPLAGCPSADSATAGEVLAGTCVAAHSTCCLVQAAASQHALSVTVHRFHAQSGMHHVWTHLSGCRCAYCVGH